MFAKKEYCGSHHFNMTSSINRKNEYNELNLFQCLYGHLKKKSDPLFKFPGVPYEGRMLHHKSFHSFIYFDLA